MRSLPISLLLFGAFVAIFVACKKESPRPNDKYVDAIGVGKSGGADCLRNVRVVCGMLAFNDQAHFQEVYDCLEAAYEGHMDAFEAQWGHLSEDDFNDMADNLGFIDEQPLIDFEVALSFSSYREWYFGELNLWLDSGEDPEDFAISDKFSDVILQTMYNVDGSVIVGGTIYHVDDQGTAWQFCTCDAYEDYLQDPSAYENSTDPCAGVVKDIFEGSGFICRNHEKNCWWTSISSDRKVQQTLSYYYGPPSFTGYSTGTAEIKSYKWKFSKWRLRRTPLKVRVHGLIRNDVCKEGPGIDRVKGYKLRRMLSVHRGTSGLQTFVDGEIKGEYWFTINGLTDQRALNSWYLGCY